MKNTNYIIENKNYEVSIKGSPEFTYGKDEFLSNEDNDITFSQTWYDKGYSEEKFLDEGEFKVLKGVITNSIKTILENEHSINTDGFELENYHKYVTTNESHFKVVSKTRSLFDNDFMFPVDSIIEKLGGILSMGLSDINPKTSEKQWVIVRVNRPNSNDFNPPHKDIYEGVDNHSYIPQFLNFWIPIAGVTNRTSLPIAPKSHKLNENTILRTFEGGFLEGNKYRVRMIKSWNGGNELYRSKVKYGEVLMFSGHLIHGMGVNNEEDITRVALEFRLFKQN